MTSAALNLSTACMVLLSILGALLAQPLLQWLYASNVPADKLGLVVALTRILFLQTIFLGMGVIINGVLNARQHFFLPALGTILFPAGSILGVIVGGALKWSMHADNTVVVYCATWGVVLGAVLMVAIQLPGLKLIGMQYRFTLDWRHPGIWQMVRQMIPRIANALMISLSTNVDLVLIGLLVSVTGAQAKGYTTLYLNAFTISSIPLSVIIQVATATFPRMSGYVAEGRIDKLRALVLEALQSVLFISIPAAFGLMAVSLSMVQVLYHVSFAQAQTSSILLFCYALGLPALALVEILTRPFYALRQSRLPVYVSVGQFVVKIALSLLLLNPMIWFVQLGWLRFWPTTLSQSWLMGAWGMGALAVATSIAAMLEALVLLWLLHIRVDGLHLRTLLSFCVRVIIAACSMLVAITLTHWLLDSLLGQSSGDNSHILNARELTMVALKLLLAMGVGALVYLRAVRFLRVLGGERLQPIQRMLIRLRLAWV